MPHCCDCDSCWHIFFLTMTCGGDVDTLFIKQSNQREVLINDVIV